MRSVRRPGFSLIELLLVIFLLALLAALVFQAVQGARATAQSIRCANNLHQIGLGYAHRVLALRKSFASDESWESELLPYMENNKGNFVCPVDTQAAAGETAPQFSLLVHTGGGAYSIPFQKNPAGPLGAPQPYRCRLAAAQPAPPSYVLEFEDANDWDFNDLVVRVDPGPGGTFTVTGVSKSAAYAYDLQGPGGQVLTSDFGPGSKAEAGGASQTSYGVNSHARYFQGADAGKVLALEYHRVVADVVGPLAAGNYAGDVAPRHWKRLNVLYVDGRVERVRAADVDPGVSSLLTQYWKPAADGP